MGYVCAMCGCLENLDISNRDCRKHTSVAILLRSFNGTGCYGLRLVNGYGNQYKSPIPSARERAVVRELLQFS